MKHHIPPNMRESKLIFLPLNVQLITVCRVLRIGLSQACRTLQLEHKPMQLLTAKQVYALVCEHKTAPEFMAQRIINIPTTNLLATTSKVLMADPRMKIVVANEDYVIIESTNTEGLITAFIVQNIKK